MIEISSVTFVAFVKYTMPIPSWVITQSALYFFRRWIEIQLNSFNACVKNNMPLPPSAFTSSALYVCTLLFAAWLNYVCGIHILFRLFRFARQYCRQCYRSRLFLKGWHKLHSCSFFNGFIVECRVECILNVNYWKQIHTIGLGILYLHFQVLYSFWYIFSQ